MQSNLVDHPREMIQATQLLVWTAKTFNFHIPCLPPARMPA
jgi:hypothetical protein